MSDKPRWVERQKSGNGYRWYWRPRDEPSVALGPDRMEAWAKAHELNRQRDARRAGLDRPPRIEDTVRWLMQRYLASSYYLDKADKTRHEYRRAATWLIDTLGDLPCDAVTTRVVQEIKDAGRSTPWETNARIRFLALVWAWGKQQDLVRVNPGERFKRLRTAPRSVVWTPAEVSLMLAEGTPSMRVAVALGLYTLQREGDLLTLPWSAVSGGRFELRQAKTNKLVAAELHPVLRQALDATRRTGIQVLISEATGRPYLPDHFRHVFAHDRARLGIRGELQFRDLRRTGAVTLGRLGRPVQQIAALAGWEIGVTLEILKTYLPLDEQMATAAIRQWAARL